MNVIKDMNIRVLHVVTDFPYLKQDKIYNYGGLGLCVMQLIDGLISAGCKIDVLTKDEKDTTKELYEGNVYRTPYIVFSSSRNWKLTHALTLVPKLVHLIVRKDYDVIHVHNPPAALFAAPIAKILGKPVIMTMHGPWARVRERFRGLASFIEKFSMIFPDKITFDSLSLSAEYQSSERNVVIGNAVDMAKFIRYDTIGCRKKLRIPLEGKAVLYSGRSVYGKNLNTIVDLAKMLPDVNFVIAGEKISGMPNIVNLGVLSNDDMPFAYSACDALVLDSVAEGMSRAVLEAMSCECAVFLSDISANKEAIGHIGCGIIFRNAVHLSELIGNTPVEYMHSMGMIGRNKIGQDFSVERRINAFIRLYFEILGKRHLY